MGSEWFRTVPKVSQTPWEASFLDFPAQIPILTLSSTNFDFDAFGRFHALALQEGLYFPPSQYEAVFLSAAISDKDIDFLAAGIESALSKM